METDKWDINNPPILTGTSWQEDLEEYIRDAEPDEAQKSANWSVAIGLQAVDGLTPSKYLLEVAKKNITGEISIDKAKNLISKYYSEKYNVSPEDKQSEECDIVSSRIAEILSEKAFNFSPLYLKNIHQRLFKGIIRHAGEYRTYNITKKEWILKGDTVLYSSFEMIAPTLEYDFQEEKKIDYDKLDNEQTLRAIAKFVSSIWQVHPFEEGNTRTTVVFMIKRLNSLGFNVSNEPFQNDSWYFRNSLVRANYRNREAGIAADDSFLKLILRNAMFGESNVLKNRYIHVEWDDAFENSTPQDTPEDTPQDTPQDDRSSESLLEVLGFEELSANEIMEKMGLSDRKNFRNLYLKPCLERGLIEMTIPDKPTSKHQKYRVTKLKSRA